MKLNKAILLVRNKYLEEQKGRIETPLAEEYGQALKDFPVTMATALYFWATEAAKT